MVVSQEPAAPKETPKPVKPVEEKVEPKPEPAKPAGPAKEAKQETAKRSVVLPMILGGLIAGGIGFGIATYVPSMADQFASQSALIETLDSQRKLQDETISGLQAKIDDLSNRPTADLSGDIAALNTRLDELTAALAVANTKTVSVAEKLAELEKRPLNEAVSPAAIAAYEGELETLKAAVNAQQDRIKQVAADATAQIEAARSDAAELETQAAEISRQGTAQAAVQRIQAAIDSGLPFSGVLGELSESSDVTIPTALSNVASDGVATIVALQSDFPDLARAALSEARSEGGEDGVAGFLKSQLGVRSLSPQDGTSPDAVLSRAQFAMKEARLRDALAELETLPDAAKAVFADWTAQAQTRVAAQSAAADLADAVTQN